MGQEDQRSRDIVAWISALNFCTKQNDFFARQHQGTGKWLLRNAVFKSWLDGTERILWCPGLPGAGKTILASIIVDYLERTYEREESVAIGYIYCSYKEQENQTEANLIASLLQQLVRQGNAIISDGVVALYDRHTRSRTRPTLSECSTLLELEVHRFSKVFVIIDALGECPEVNGTRTNVLTGVRGLQPSIHLLVTSRHILAIERELGKAARVEIRASEEDVGRYLEGRIERESRLTRNVREDPSLQEEIVATVVKKAQGMFLLAQLHIDSLARQHNRRAVRLALKNLPKELDGTYGEAMLRIRGQGAGDAELAEKVLYWISYALRPLKVQEILATQPGDVELDEEALTDEDLLISVCAGLVTIDRESDIIRLVHYTTREYFERIREDQFPYAQGSIAVTCLTYLSFNVFAGSALPGRLEWVSRQHEYPFLEYAAHFWGDHARGDPEEAIKEVALKYFQLHWKLTRFDMGRYSTEDTLCIATGVTGLHIAASFGLERTAWVVLEESIDIGSRDSLPRTPLGIGAETGYDAVMQLLLEKSADVNTTAGEETVLHIAARKGDKALVRQLLEKGADVNIIAGEETVLHITAGRGDETLVRLLLEKGAGANVKNFSGQTALDIATRRGYEAVANLLTPLTLNS